MSGQTAGLRKRLGAGLGANLFGRGVTSFIQFFTLNLLIKYWGAGLTAEWNLLNNIPSYFAMSDMGFGSTAGNEMTMLMATNRRDEALDVFQSVLALTSGISVVIGVLFMSVVWFLPLDRWVKVTLTTRHDMNLAILYLALSVLFSMQETLYQAAFRCVGKYAYGGVLKNIIQLIAFLGILAEAMLGGGVVKAALAFCLLNALGTLVLWFELRRAVPWIRFGLRHARIDTIKRLAGPSISFMAFPFGNALNLQGMVMLVAYVLGPAASLVFQSARMLSRTAIQFMQMINNTVWPEMSTAFGLGDLDLARRLHRRACQVSVTLGFAVVLPLSFLGPWFWVHLTRHQLPSDHTFFELLLITVIFSSLWFTSSVALAAANKHQRMAMVYLVATTLTMCAAILMTKHFGLRGTAIAMNVGEMLMAAYVLRASLKLLGDTLGGFMKSMVTVPRLRRGGADLVVESR